ncbi:Avirulence (Avh) protein [Phytophthora megakarya]|uniref:Avirulence (Avh) protein n=1 Tax=Phytophthora megakarya TaxID=4795 RepID=A0A225X1M1_9STRA|nr:Avirulence (Avh) protein [Phytophthora megakarya]
MQSYKSVSPVVVVIILVFAVCIKSETTVFKPHLFGQHRTLTKRTLRDQNATNEERVIGDLSTLRTWLHDQKFVDDVLDTLLLNGRVEEVVQNPNFKLLDNYVDMFNSKYPKQKMSLIEILTARHSEFDLAQALMRAKQSENTRNIATKLQNQQLKGWLNSQKTIDDAYSLLKIKEDGIISVISPKQETMHKYIQLFNAKYPQQKTDLYRVLCDGFGGEDKFAILISHAMEHPATAGGASKYRCIMFRQWLEKDYDPMSVLINVIKYTENNVATTSSREKSIVAVYKPIYYREMGLDM